MFAGQPGVWPLPWDKLWAHHQGSRLRDHHPGQADREAREPSREDEGPSEDHLHSDDDRSPVGLPRQGERRGWRWLVQRRYPVGERTTPLNARRILETAPELAGIGEEFGGAWRNYLLRFFPYALVLLLLLLIPLKDTRPGSAQAAYDYASKLFQQGRLTDSQQAAELAYRQFQIADPDWAASSTAASGNNGAPRMYSDALGLLASYHPDSTIRKKPSASWRLRLMP